MKSIKIMPLILAASVIPGAAQAEQIPVLSEPLFTIEVAKPWEELERVIVVNDSARYDEDALSSREAVLALPVGSRNPG